MAFLRVLRYSVKSSDILKSSNFVSLKSPESLLFRTCWFTTSNVILTEKEAPVKYSTSKAAKITINENLGRKTNISPLGRNIVTFSLMIFLVYFCILREENDIDERLKGNPEYMSDVQKLSTLYLQLSYCRTNNMPTEQLEAKIEELKKKVDKKES